MVHEPTEPRREHGGCAATEAQHDYLWEDAGNSNNWHGVNDRAKRSTGLQCEKCSVLWKMQAIVQG